MSQNKFDPSLVSDNKSAVSVFAQAIRRVYRGELGGHRFHALVLAPPERIAASGEARTIFKYKARIIKAANNAAVPNPHAILPDPCELSQANTDAAKKAINDAIRLHTTFYSTYMSSQQQPTGGDIVIVSLNLGANGAWDLGTGEHLGIARKGAWVASGRSPQECQTLAARVKAAAETAPRVATVSNSPWQPCFPNLQADGTAKGSLRFVTSNPELQTVPTKLQAWFDKHLPGAIKIHDLGILRSVRDTYKQNEPGQPQRDRYSLHMIGTAVDFSISVLKNLPDGTTPIDAAPGGADEGTWRKSVASSPLVMGYLQAFAPVAGAYLGFETVPGESTVVPTATTTYSGVEQLKSKGGIAPYGQPLKWGGNLPASADNTIVHNGDIVPGGKVNVQEIGHLSLADDSTVYTAASRAVPEKCRQAIKDKGSDFADLYGRTNRSTLYDQIYRDLLGVSE